MHDVELKRKWDNANVLAGAREEGLLKGKEEGLLEGRREGILHTKAAVVRNLLFKLGMTDDQAAEIAEVAIEFVREVRGGQR